MNKSVEEYLKILYPNIDSLSEEEQKRFEKDKNFLLEFFDDFTEEYNKNNGLIERYGEYEVATLALEECKSRLDRETIIIDYVQSMFKRLNSNSYISNNYEAFMDIMHFERTQAEHFKGEEIDQTPIDLENVFSLTEEFLSQIDESQELVAKFINLKEHGKIVVLSPNNTDAHSFYKDGVVNYVFDGTVNSAYTLLHEFMHYWVEIKAQPTNDREEHTMFNEFESIYYENAFIQFMDNKGFLKKGVEPLKAVRLQREYAKDPNNCIIMLLELCQNIKNNGTINKDSIIDMLQKYMPDITSPEELWSKGSNLLSEFCKEHIFAGETINGPVMYRFNTGLVLQTNLDQDTIRTMYQLAPLLRDKNHDSIFMERYIATISKKDKTFSNSSKEGKITPTAALKNALKTGITSGKVAEATNIMVSGEKKLEQKIKE